MSVIVVSDLVKKYGAKEVLHGVRFNVASGGLVGFLGPNGAGKSTTIRILLGLLKSTSGSAEVFGQDSSQFGANIRSRIGYLPGEVNLYRNLSGVATLKHFERVRRVKCVQYGFELADKLNLDLNQKVRSYSSGMKQKLGLIQALMHEPELLVLDEPTSALDPLVKKVVFDLLRGVSRSGRTVLFSSHSLHEVEELCDEVIILRDGAVVEQNSIEKLKERAVRRVDIEFATPPSEIPSQFKVRVQKQNRFEGTWTGTPNGLAKYLSEHSVNQFSVERPDLEDLFLTYYSPDESVDGCGDAKPLTEVASSGDGK